MVILQTFLFTNIFRTYSCLRIYILLNLSNNFIIYKCGFMKLFIIYIGGEHEKSFIELHDMRFIVAEKIEDTHQAIIDSWWGRTEKLHLDAWGTLEYVDGYDILIKDHPQENQEYKLFFMNLGGYDSKQFTELHKNIFVVAESPSKAKIKALKQILDWESFHRDYQFEIDDIIDISTVITKDNKYIHLEPSSNAKEFEFICKYTKIT